MTVGIRRVVSQRAQRKGIFVEVVSVAKQCQHEIAASHIVNKVTEVLTAERIIAQVLNDTTAVGIGMGFYQIFGGSTGELTT